MTGSVLIVPLPSQTETGEGSFLLRRSTCIFVGTDDEEVRMIAQALRDRIRAGTGLDLRIQSGSKVPKRNAVVFSLSADSVNGEEGYRLLVESGCIRMKACRPAGLFHAVQSLLQLFHPDFFRDRAADGVRWAIPCVDVQDKPRYAWRGLHLDVSRHFFPAAFIKRMLDRMAFHKLNVFHWHLVDGPGWRIEIKKYPNLTRTGAWRVDKTDRPWRWLDTEIVKPGDNRKRYGGFYTQEEVREIVAYAADRFITIVPEIEMPGHSYAALVSYPEYACPNADIRRVGLRNRDVFCAGQEGTYSFLQDILSEVIELFPSEFIHIGGDEVNKAVWESCAACQFRIRSLGLKDEEGLQSYFIRRMSDFLESKDRRLIGWDEIMQGGLAPGAAVMSWRGLKPGIRAARMGHEVVMCPTSHCYFDYYQGDRDLEPEAFGGFLPLSRVYAFDPTPDELTEEEAEHILGAQANVWTEHIKTESHAEYMIFPRLAAFSEAVWSSAEARDWEDFYHRLRVQLRRYDAQGIHYATSAFNVTMKAVPDPGTGAVIVSLDSEAGGTEIRMTIDGEDPNAESRLYEGPFRIDRSTVIRAASFERGIRLGRVSQRTFHIHKASSKRVNLKYPFSRQYSAGGAFGLTDGLRGSRALDDGHWQGFHQVDFDAAIDLQEARVVRRITVGFLQAVRSWIWLPEVVEFFVSIDGESYERVGRSGHGVSQRDMEVLIREFTADLPDVEARFVRVYAKNVGLCPAWHGGAGGKAWLFVDEIIVE